MGPPFLPVCHSPDWCILDLKMEPSRRADVEVADWLRGLGLERYEQTFCDNEIDPEILLDLNEADLETLGMPLGSRKRLLKAIAALRQQASPGNGSAATPLEHGPKLGHRLRPGLFVVTPARLRPQSTPRSKAWFRPFCG